MNQLLDKTENRLLRFWQGVDKPLLTACYLAALGFMLAAHGFAFTNLFPNHDSTVLTYDAQWTMYVLGRWGQNVYYPLVRGKIAAPWLIGLFSTAFVAQAGYCAARLLRFGRTAAVLLVGFLSTAASVTAMLATYTLYTDAFLLGMLLAILGVWFTVRLHPLPGTLLGGTCFCLSLSFYQAYIQFAVGLFLLLLLQSALADTPWRAWIRQGLRAVLALVCGGVLYLVSVKAILAVTGYELADGTNGMAQLTQLGPAAMLAAIPATYLDFFKTLLGSSDWNDRGMRVAVALVILLGIVGAMVRLRGKSRRSVVQFLLAAALLPFALDLIYLLTSGQVYILMQHAAFLGFALPLLLIFPQQGSKEVAPRLLWQWCTVLLCAFWMLRAVICANGAYVYTKLMYDNTARNVTAIMAQVESLPGYEHGVTPVAFAGDFRNSAAAYQNSGFNRYAAGDLHQANSGITYDGTIAWWFRNVMGSTANVVAQGDELETWAADPRVQAMPVYPAAGYCAIIDGTAVVKMS